MKQSLFSYKTLQRIKAQEFELFFRKINRNYYPFLNHLGEIKWMTEQEAEDQHEFFLYTANPWINLKKKLEFKRYPDWNKLSDFEKELRLQFRAYLEKTYLGDIQPDTARLMPQSWQDELSAEKIESIPITLDIYKSAGFNKTILFSLVGVFILVAAIIYFFPSTGKSDTGSIIIESNARGASVFLDDTKKGYADLMHIIREVPAGTTRVSLKKAGYTSKPTYYDVEVIPDSTITLYFQLEPIQLQEQGYLKILADYSDSKLFINDDFYGILSEMPLVLLKEGDYRVSIEKPGYENTPKSASVSIVRGDTTIIAFQQSSTAARIATRRENRVAETQGTLEISTNIHGARIYLNDRDTGKESDYVFTEMPLGQYKIKVVKDGYQPIPPEHSLTLTSGNPTAEISFELIKQFESVTIQTNPPEGDIIIDGKVRGKGLFEGTLETGQHKITFGKLADYNTPQEQIINLQPNAPVNIQVDYFPRIRLSVEVSNDGNVKSQECDYKYGFTLSNRGFSASSEAGPEIFYFDNLKNYYWKFGFAFPYRNPKGNDALQVSFRLPQDLKYNQKFTFTLHAAASRDRYPLALSSKVDIKVKLNGNILSYNYTPKFFDEVNGMDEMTWDISRFVKPGTNYLEITTTDDNNTYYLVKKIEIHN